MKITSLIASSFRFYVKSNAGLLFGAFLASAILSGSLVVGDSVRASLQHAAAQRLGKVQTGVMGGDRWFTEELARMSGADPLILIRGAVSANGGQSRANSVQVLGVDDGFWRLGPSGKVVTIPSDGVAVNESLARKLGVKIGDSVIVRVEKPSAISRDAPLSGEANQETRLTYSVAAIVSGEDFGNFRLQASQIAPDSIFIPLAALADALGQKRRANTMLGSGSGGSIAASLKANATIEDFSLKLSPLSGSVGGWQVTTDRIFLDDVIADNLLANLPDSSGAITYLINDFISTKGHAPYSFATAARIEANPDAYDTPSIFINRWLADDLQLADGDEMKLRYFVVGNGRALEERTTSFTVREILPMTDPRVNPSWTPDFPGVSEASNCRDWKPGIPMKLDAIRDKDEAYWKQYRATPKAFISLREGERIWGNRFGKLTSVRVGAGKLDEAGIRRQILSNLKLSDIGLVPRDFRSEAAAAAKGSVDFGGLFAGLSLFLIAAAFVFSALLFLFTLEKRASQIGLLLAIGWSQRQARWFILGEAGLVALVGAVIGMFGGLGYTKLALDALNGVWTGATVGLQLIYSANPVTLLIAFLISVLGSIGTLWWASRRIFKTRAKDLLAGEAWVASRPAADDRTRPGFLRRSWRWLLRLPLVRDPAMVATVFVALAFALSYLGSRASDPEEIASMFFTSGFCFLIAGLILARSFLRKASAGTQLTQSLTRIGLRNVTRRPGRSLAVIGMMAGGIFLVIAVNAFRIGAVADPTKRDSGTGGFALIGESTLPIYEDLNTPAAWDAFALDDKLMHDVKVVPFRVREGDDASCLNLNKAQTPVLCGVNPKLLAERKAFAFAEGSWDGLSRKQEVGGQKSDSEIPAVADQATAMWGLGKGIGDTLSYTDAQGREFRVKLVGLLAGSVLQGKVIISEQDFIAKFPDAAGYKFFLMDAPPAKASEARSKLTSQLELRGLALETAAQRLETFNSVQNTYIGIFTVLGGLGVLLGTAGLGVLAARNILERRGEFGLMQAIGFQSGALRRMVLSEHATLLAAGLVLGLLSAAFAVWPDVKQSGGALPVAFLLWLNLGIFTFGAVVCWLAARIALRGNLMDSLRRE